jgi:hypothetical protein
MISEWPFRAVYVLIANNIMLPVVSIILGKMAGLNRIVLSPCCGNAKDLKIKIGIIRPYALPESIKDNIHFPT